MRFRNLVYLAISLGPVMAGCAKDPLVYGPYLIGAERPVIRDGVCCPLGDMRSQDVRGDWRPCEYEKTYCHKPASPVDVPVTHEDYLDDLKAAAPVRKPAGPRRVETDARSAW